MDNTEVLYCRANTEGLRSEALLAKTLAGQWRFEKPQNKWWEGGPPP
jgi:hypothetical protein